jgi:hypothetical protein
MTDYDSVLAGMVVKDWNGDALSANIFTLRDVVKPP